MWHLFSNYKSTQAEALFWLIFMQRPEKVFLPEDADNVSRNEEDATKCCNARTCSARGHHVTGRVLAKELESGESNGTIKMVNRNKWQGLNLSAISDTEPRYVRLVNTIPGFFGTRLSLCRMWLAVALTRTSYTKKKKCLPGDKHLLRATSPKWSIAFFNLAAVFMYSSTF